PDAVYEADTSGTHYLNVQSWSGEESSFVIKIYSNTPAAPLITPSSLPEGTTTPATITMTSTDNIPIYYTFANTDNTKYTYSDPFALDIGSRIAAYTVKDGIYSAAATGMYWFTDTKYPQFSPSLTTQSIGTVISIIGAADGDTVYYTTDGSNPYNSVTRQVYEEPSAITVDTSGLELRAIIKNANGVFGDSNWNNYVRGTTQPNISNIPGGNNPGTYGDAFDAVLVSSTGASIYYTLDGTTATTSGTLYTEPIQVDKNTRIRAIAVQDGITSTEMNQFLNITNPPRTISVGETLQGMSNNYGAEWFTFNIPDPGSYNFEIIPNNAATHGFVYYSDWYSTHYPVILYDESGAQLSNSLYPINNMDSMKYNFTTAGTYKLKISSRISTDDLFSLKIVQGIKDPVPSIPVDSSYSKAYIKEGALTLSTTEVGGRIFYTTDGSQPAMSATGTTSEFTSDQTIALATTDAYKDITVKAITVINAGTESATSGVVKTFNYKVIPQGLDLSGIKYGYYGYYLFNETDVYSSDSYDIRVAVPSDSYSGYAIAAIDFEIMLDNGSDEWISLGTVTGSAVSNDYTYNKKVNWSRVQTPFAGKATLRATSSDIVGNSFCYEIPINIQMSSPTAPQNLSATPVQGGVELNWDPSTYPSSFYYLIYRGVAEDQLTELIGQVYYTNSTTYTDIPSDPTSPLYY
ncbi:MAG: chitobiase/beta-hexosaminidase C-terminal domain-containing protein, partial [Desulfosporosinus sp.]